MNFLNKRTILPIILVISVAIGIPTAFAGGGVDHVVSNQTQCEALPVSWTPSWSGSTCRMSGGFGTVLGPFDTLTVDGNIILEVNILNNEGEVIVESGSTYLVTAEGGTSTLDDGKFTVHGTFLNDGGSTNCDGFCVMDIYGLFHITAFGNHFNTADVNVKANGELRLSSGGVFENVGAETVTIETDGLLNIEGGADPAEFQNNFNAAVDTDGEIRIDGAFTNIGDVNEDCNSEITGSNERLFFQTSTQRPVRTFNKISGPDITQGKTVKNPLHLCHMKSSRSPLARNIRDY